MRISELSTELRRENPQSHSPLLVEIEGSIKEAERLTPDDVTPGKLSGELQKSLSRLNSVLPLSEPEKLQIWKLSYRLWNACVDLSNAVVIRSEEEENKIVRCKIDEEQAKLRQISADLVYLAGDISGIPSPAFKSASFYYRTGLIWHDLKKFDLASNCFERATERVSKVDVEEIPDGEERKLLLDLNIARSRTAWEVSERNLALILLNRSKNFLFGNPESYRTLAEQYLQFGKFVLSKDERSAIREALKMINEALDLSEKGLGFASVRSRSGEIQNLKNLQAKSLRFLAAGHLQIEEFQNVLKCVRVLRDTCGTGCGDHPSVSFLAMKAWLGMGKHAEAEKELRGMIVNKEVPEGICVSAMETFLQTTGVAGAETAQRLFVGLLSRCHVSAGTAVRVAQRILACGGEGLRVRMKVVSDLISDEKVMALFAGEGKEEANERGAMHAVLWNSGAELFRAKEYEMSAEMFEKSMLYVSHDVENRIVRAKCFRVLCLCHLGLNQLDRAEEYINEAEKLEPNVASAFLKFKIYLQKDENGAINQMQSMINCLDFSPEFLNLSAHEAMACRALPVAIASLCSLLNLYSPGKQMPMQEVAVRRNIIALLFQNPCNETEILKHMKHARTRISELGVENFFGKGDVGSRELTWFARNSWNMAIKTGRENKYEFSAEFWEMAADFYSEMEDEMDANRVMVYKSLILGVAAMINGEKQRNAALADGDVKRALGLLDRAARLLTSNSTASPLADHQPTIEPNFAFLYAFSSYDLLGRIDDARHKQLLLIKSFASSKSCTPQNLLQIGLTASCGPRSNYEAADFALNACLTSLLASTSSNYVTVAVVVRKLITLAGFKQGDPNDEAYALYRQAYRIMVGLKEGEYPVEEAKWLATTAWNRSILPGRLGHMEAAVKWMQMGMELARHVPGMDEYSECMDRCLANAVKLREKAQSFQALQGSSLVA